MNWNVPSFTKAAGVESESFNPKQIAKATVTVTTTTTTLDPVTGKVHKETKTEKILQQGE